MTEKPEEKKPETTNETPAAETNETPDLTKIEGLEAGVKQLAACKVEVKVRVPVAAIKAEMQRAFDELALNAAVPGFRKGHTPRRLVERHFEKAVLEDTKRLITAKAWEQVVKENDLHPIGEPDLPDEKVAYDAEKGLSFELELEVMPKFDAGEYKGLELTRPAGGVSEEDVTKTLDGLRRRNAQVEAVPGGKTQEDDVPVVDVDIKVGDQVVQTVSDQEITLGVDNWLRGLDRDFWKDLLGKTAGESASKTVTLPDTYQKEAYRGKEAVLTVTVKDVKRPKLAELNDEFAKDMLYESLEELKKDIRERIAQGRDHEAHQALAAQVEEKLIAANQFALPEELVKSMTANLINRQRLSLAYRGATREDIEKATPEITEGATKQTERDVRLLFILQQIADKEKIEVTDAEFERRIHVLAQAEGQKPGRFREDLKAQGRLGLIRSEIRDEKTVSRIIELAKVKDAEAAPAKEEAKEEKKEKKAPKAEKAEKPAEAAKEEKPEAAESEKKAAKKAAKKPKKE